MLDAQPAGRVLKHQRGTWFASLPEPALESLQIATLFCRAARVCFQRLKSLDTLQDRLHAQCTACRGRPAADLVCAFRTPCPCFWLRRGEPTSLQSARLVMSRPT